MQNINISDVYLPEGRRIGTAENREYTSSEEGLMRAAASGKILEGIAVLCDAGMNLSVDLGSCVACIPAKETLYVPQGEEIKSIAVLTRVGKAVCFKVLSVGRSPAGKLTAVLSRRAAQIDFMNNCMPALAAGDIIDAKVTHLEHFGAFADIGCGIISLLAIDCISVSRISHPKDRFYTGQNIKAVIKAIDRRSGRVTLSQRELFGTWRENAALFEVGQTVAGIVRSVEYYGVFIELMPNLAGLAEYQDELRPGVTAAVYIKSIIEERMKIKLAVVDAHSVLGITDKNKLHYFIEESETHIDYWRYSPRCCPKVIETNFMQSDDTENEAMMVEMCNFSQTI